MGLGVMLNVQTDPIPRSMANWLIEKFDSYGSILELNGQYIDLTPPLFEVVMGVRDGGKPVQVCGHARDIVGLFDEILLYPEGISILHLAILLRDGDDSGDTFQRRFTLFVLGTILSPSSSQFLDRSFLHTVSDVTRIPYLNWPTWALNYLIEGVRQFRDGRCQYVQGCILFLQMLYLHMLREGDRFVYLSLCPVSAWKRPAIKKLVRNFFLHGRYGSETVQFRKLEDTFDPTKKVEAFGESAESYKSSVFDEGLRLVRREVAFMSMTLSQQSTTSDLSILRSEVRSMRGCMEKFGFDISEIKENIYSFLAANKTSKKGPCDVRGQAIPPTKKAHASYGERTPIGKRTSTTVSKVQFGPFQLTMPLDGPSSMVFNYFFDATLSASEIVVQMDTYFLTRKSIMTLLPHELVDGEVICIIAEMETHAEQMKSTTGPIKWFLPTDYAHKVLSNPEDILSWTERNR